MRILLAGGGTAGHINPALSIAAYAKKCDESTQVLFVGKKGNMEETLVANQGYDMEFIDIEGIKRELTLKNLKVAYKTLQSTAVCRKIIKKFKPDIVICTGGYVSGPLMYAAKLAKIPSIIHEQNVFPGVTVKMAASFADCVAISFDETRKYLSGKAKCELTGNPVREEILNSDYETARKNLKLDARPFVLAFGGSLGAMKINEAVCGYIKELVRKNDVQLLFGTGKRNYDEVIGALKDAGIDLDFYDNINVVPYIHNMADAMAAADIVISRAGAISISEITAMGKSSILIPSPNVAHNHQFYNASLLEQNNACILLDEKVLSPMSLAKKINSLKDNEGLRGEMGKNAREMGTVNACEKIYEIAKRLTNS